MENAITFTVTATKKLRQIIEDNKVPESFGVRLGLKGGGCHGWQNRMDFEVSKENDHVFEFDGFKVFVDPMSMMYLEGSEIDYIEGLGLGSVGFKFNSDKITSKCSCGSSVSYE